MQNKRRLIMTNINPDLYLYHTTPRKNIEYIKKRGLIHDIEARVIRDFDAEDFLRNNSVYNESEIEELKQNEDYWYDLMEEVPKISGRLGINHHLPIQENAVFFYKELPTRVPKDIAILRINAKNIPCRCLEANAMHSETIFGVYANEFDDQEIPEAVEEYNTSLRLLDTKKNDYTTEVMCHCDIFPDSIEFDY